MSQGLLAHLSTPQQAPAGAKTLHSFLRDQPSYLLFLSGQALLTGISPSSPLREMIAAAANRSASGFGYPLVIVLILAAKVLWGIAIGEDLPALLHLESARPSMTRLARLS